MLVHHCRLACAHSQTYQIQLSGQVGSTAIGSLIPISLVVLKEVLLVLQRISNGLLVLDITLTTVNDWDVAQAQRNDAAGKNINDVGPLVPVQIYRLASTQI